MCGICGVHGFASQGGVKELVQRMCAQIVHRGPDDEGLHIDQGVGLGMRRLSIIDVDGGAQPMFNEDRTVAVVLNGEIYNFEELRNELLARGHQLATRSDTEVIAHLYEEHGDAFVERLNGMFAIALWDSVRRRLVVVRDRLGVKPVFYAAVGGQLLFGSEIKTLLQYEHLPRELDHRALYDYFSLGYIPQPRSIYTAIRKLPPGCRLIADDQGRRVERYWEIPDEVDHAMAREDAIHRLKELLADATRLRMISDVPLGAFLSGGLDSSIVVALMAQMSSRPVKTFFIDFDETGYSERGYARAIATRFGTEHHELVVRPSALDVLDQLIHFLDEPFGDSSAIPTYYVSKLTREHVTVALAGDGGDESFGGYARYQGIVRRSESPWIRNSLRSATDWLGRRMPRTAPGRRYVHSVGMSNREYYVGGTQEADARRLLSPDVLDVVAGSLSDELEAARPGAWNSSDPLLPYSRFDLQWYLPDDVLTKVDRMSMAHSLEVRGPFLDYRVVELAARMPAAWKITQGISKSILKEAFREELPAEVLAPRKRGFSIPLADWLRKELRETLLETVNDPALAASGLLNPREVQGLVHEHLSGARNRKSQLWRILYFARWWRTMGGSFKTSSSSRPARIHSPSAAAVATRC